MKQINIIHLSHVDKKTDQWIEEYIKRCTRFKLSHTRLKPEKFQRATTLIEKVMAIKNENSAHFIALDAQGKQFESEDFAVFLDEKIPQQNIIFLIGESEGIPEELIQLSDYKLSLSQMTLPHQMARLILFEQIYRAECILKKHPYHK